MFLKTDNPTYLRPAFRFFSVCVLILSFTVAGVPAGAVHLSPLNNSCVDCHRSLSPFTEEETRLNEIRIEHLERNVSCSLECHEDVIRRTASDNFRQWENSDHSEYFVTCDACHGGNSNALTEAEAHAEMKGPNDPTSNIYFKNVHETCGTCHAVELDHFKNTMHYQRLRATASGPSCITCHNPHSFKVLKASELTALCSTCHNQKDQIATASVPQDAKKALEKQEELKKEILKAKIAVDEARAAGIDISSAQINLEKAQAVMDDIPSLWHSFDLKNFDAQVQNGIDWAKKAEFRASSAETTVQTPFAGIPVLLGILAVLYAMKKKK